MKYNETFFLWYPCILRGYCNLGNDEYNGINNVYYTSWDNKKKNVESLKWWLEPLYLQEVCLCGDTIKLSSSLNGTTLY